MVQDLLGQTNRRAKTGFSLKWIGYFVIRNGWTWFQIVVLLSCQKEFMIIVRA